MANATATLVKAAKDMLPEVKGRLPGPKSRAIIDRDKAVMSSSYTRDYPFVMDRGEGCLVWDADGNRFLDMAAGIAVCSTGHSHPHVVNAITEQASRFLHMSGTDFYYEVQVRLAERLFKYAPIKGKKRVFFTNSGAESIEGAIKLARHATGGHQMLSFFGAFHGRTMGALSLTASKNVQRKNFSPFLPGIQHARYGDDLDYIENYVLGKAADMGNFAAIFVEVIQGEGGYIIPKREWLHGLRELCTRHKILLVVDEVQSGMGRTGKMFACEHFGLEPDIMTFAKGIASGLPLGGFMAKAEIMDWGPGQHGTTFGGNPVACAAANATMDLLEDGLMENARVVGDYLRERLAELETRVPHVKNARGLGLMLAIDVVDDTGEYSSALRNDIITDFYENGILALGCGAHAIRFCPPLCLTKEQADYTVETLAKICKALPAKSKHPAVHEDGVAS
ncbi:MAG: acetyl ornithine aminotransferase family protein [Candidatus Sumerlaeaceae bacterium]